MLFMPIVVLFYEENGLTLHEVFIVQAFYSVSVVLLEIPTGYFADVWGRRNTMIIGNIFIFLGYIVMSFSYDFWGFIAAGLLLGLGLSFVSGSDSALLYDTLFSVKRSNLYLKYEGQITSAGNFAEAFAAILGGFLATYSLRYPYYGQTILAFIAIPASFVCTEPPVHKEKRRASFADIFNILRYSLIENKQLRMFLLFSSVTGTATLSMAWMVQPYFKEVNVPLYYYGILWTILNLLVGLIAMWAHKIDAFFQEKKTLWIILIGLSIGFIFTGLFVSVYSIALIALFYMVRGIATPILKDRINKIIASDIRATVLSVRSFIIRILFSGFGPFVGWWSDNIDLGSAFIMAGLLYAISGFIFIIFYKLASKKKQTNS